MTMNFSCLRCGRQMATLAEVEAHSCSVEETAQRRLAEHQAIKQRLARRAAEASETPISREELVKACLAVRSRFGGNGTELSDAIADAFSALAEVLR